MLCALLTSITKTQGKAAADLFIAKSKYPKDLKKWWDEHQLADKKAALKKKK